MASNKNSNSQCNPLAAVPHYATPNFAAVLPEYVNAEQDIIRQAFQTGNFRYLQSLPDQIKPHSVIETRLDHMEHNRNFSMNGEYKKVLNSQGLFQSFDYQPSEYGVEKLIAKRERAQHLAILEKWNRPSFVSGSNLWKQKHEEQFPAKDRKPHEPGIKYMPDPYDAAAELAAEKRWAERSKILSGPFVPSGTHKLYDPSTRSLLPEILFELQRLLIADWPELSPHIYSDEHDLVICELVDPNPAVMPKPARRNSSSSSAAASSPSAAPLGDTTAAHNNNNNNNSNTAGSLAGMLEQFDAAALAAQEEAAAVLRGILAYMNTLLLSNEMLSKYSLTRVVEVWNHRINGCIYFTFRPPWVHSRPSDTFYTLHPEERTGSTLLEVRRKQAGEERALRRAHAEAMELGPEFAAMYVATQQKRLAEQVGANPPSSQ